MEQELLKKYYYYEMDEKEQQEIELLELTPELCEKFVKKDSAKLRFIKDVGYCLVAEGYLIMEDGSEPIQYFMREGFPTFEVNYTKKFIIGEMEQ